MWPYEMKLTYFYGTTSKRQDAAWLTLKIRDIPSPCWVLKQEETILNIFSNKWPVEVDNLEEKSTITGTYYIETVLPKVVQEMEN